jgi:hypothetical protein
VLDECIHFVIILEHSETSKVKKKPLFVDEFRGIALSRPICKTDTHCYVSVFHVCTLKFRPVKTSVSFVHIELF